MQEREKRPSVELRSRMAHTQPWLFLDRADAGRQLAARLGEYRDQQPIILALPRGGVPVAAEIAQLLGAPLDVLPVRKLGAPGQPELGVGALALGGMHVLNHAAIQELRITPTQLERTVATEAAELARQSERFRGRRPFPDLRDRTVILVDDGLATGVSALAAVRAAQTYGPRRIVLAAPVCAPETISRLRPEVDDVVCVASPPDFFAVGLWYQDFSQVSDEAVHEMLERSRRTLSAPAATGIGLGP